MKDNGIWYFIANLITFIFIFSLCLIVVIYLIKNIIIRAIILPILFLVCGYIEERLLSRFVNIFMEKMLKEK